MSMLPIVKADGVELDPAAAPSEPTPLGQDPYAGLTPAASTQADAGCGCGGCGCGGSPEQGGGVVVDVNDLDARAIPHTERHARIFEAVDALEPGESFVLLNDHDPKPLRFQLEARDPGQIGWDYLAQGPELWRVRISRAAGHCC